MVHIIIMLQINIPHSLFGHHGMVHYSITQRPLAATLPPGLNISIFYRPCKKGNDLNAGYIQWEKDFYHSIVVSNDGVFGKVCFQSCLFIIFNSFSNRDKELFKLIGSLLFIDISKLDKTAHT